MPSNPEKRARQRARRNAEPATVHGSILAEAAASQQPPTPHLSPRGVLSSPDTTTTPKPPVTIDDLSTAFRNSLSPALQAVWDQAYNEGFAEGARLAREATVRDFEVHYQLDRSEEFMMNQMFERLEQRKNDNGILQGGSCGWSSGRTTTPV
ncbi:hypothetical protein FA15DRAFT_727609 [Coprinopsis marcescibilis]|uniref:Uncharacterized protein n=1 Tax=Coprinopsis marcescibilis TaxID=230819 RepID=A0A5C3L289_COPMA|nr:hypothetical protein FA15DRAFT_727609 [Coprinopsis marcescibilis]